MATNAERQAAYRERHLHGRVQNKARIHVLIGHTEKVRLEMLARHYDIPQVAVLEKLINAENEKLSAGMTRDEHNYYTR